METIYNKINPRKVLGCLMAFAMVLFSLNVSGQVTAPYSEDFNTGVAPTGWLTGCDVTGSGWVFSGAAGWNAANNGQPAGTYAWIDFSSTDTDCWMQMVDIDVSSLSSSLLQFDLFSDPGTSSMPLGPNILDIQAYDGTAWNNISTINSWTSGWEPQFIDISGADVSGVVSLRFFATSNGSSSQDYYNDFLIDNLSVSENNLGVLGCTDPTACNYNANATTDDGSCDFTCFGCTDPNAYNYSAVATIDDASCLYGCAAGDIAITVPYAGVGLTNCGSNSVTSANANT